MTIARRTDAKVIVFSEWERMLELRPRPVPTGASSVTPGTPAASRSSAAARKSSPSEDPGLPGVPEHRLGRAGLNLQAASVVINCDLPWNPAKLEQRIARAWRKHQTRPVTVINLISENTIEHRMLASLANKQDLARGVLDGLGDLAQVKLKRGRQELLRRLEQALAATAAPPATGPAAAPAPTPAADPAAAFAAAMEPAPRAAGCALRRDPSAGSDTPVLVVLVGSSAAEQRPLLEAALNDTPWPGPRRRCMCWMPTPGRRCRRSRRPACLPSTPWATRPLLDGANPPPLTEGQRAQIASRRASPSAKRGPPCAPHRRPGGRSRRRTPRGRLPMRKPPP